MLTKECSGCKRLRPFFAFDKNKDGKFSLYSKCKECKNKVARDNYDSDKKRKYYRNNIEKIQAYRKSEKGRKLHSEHSRNYRKAHPERVRAHARVAGTLIQECCNRCGSNNTEKHHPDYDKPLEIVWLCKKCHTKEHMK